MMTVSSATLVNAPSCLIHHPGSEVIRSPHVPRLAKSPKDKPMSLDEALSEDQYIERAVAES
jgi:hypothetical protein